MNPLVFFIALMVTFFAWVLWSALRAGEYRIKSGGSSARPQGAVSSTRAEATTTIKKSEQPGVFWTLVAFNVGLILYIASIAFSLE